MGRFGSRFFLYVLYSVPAAGILSPQLACRHAAKFAARSTKRIITVTIKYVMYANKSLILTLSLTLTLRVFSVELRKNVEKSKFQKGFEPTTYRSAGKHASHTATEASLAMMYSIPL